MMRKSLVLALILLTLSCNFPGFPDILNFKNVAEPSPEVSPDTGDTDPKVDEPIQDGDEDNKDDVDTGSPTFTITPTATSTDSPPPEDDPTATHTPTQTPTSTATPTVTPTATKKAAPTSTHTPTSTNTPKAGPPMTFEDPAWELVGWNKLGDTGEWEGTIRARITGGTPPYQSKFEVNDFVDGLDMPVRWRLCKPMPATIRVISADGQDIHIGIWVWEVGCD